MSELEYLTQSITQIVSSLCAAATTIIGVVLLFRQSFMHKIMNSRLDELKAEIAASSHAAGLAEGLVRGRKIGLADSAKLIKDTVELALPISMPPKDPKDAAATPTTTPAPAPK